MEAQILLLQRSRASRPLPPSIAVSVPSIFFFFPLCLSLSLSINLLLSLALFGSNLTKQNLTRYLQSKVTAKGDFSS